MIYHFKMTKLEQIIKSKGKTKKDLADAIGISRPTLDVRCKEPIKFGINDFNKISAELGITTKELINNLGINLSGFKK